MCTPNICIPFNNTTKIHVCIYKNKNLQYFFFNLRFGLIKSVKQLTRKEKRDKITDVLKCENVKEFREYEENYCNCKCKNKSFFGS